MINSHYNILDVIVCGHCQLGDDGQLMIGQPVTALQVPGLDHCPSCRTCLQPGDVVAVGINLSPRCGQRDNDDAT